MPSTATARNRLEQQAPGENGNTWGDRLNMGVIALIDQALDGMTSFALSADKTLSSTNFATDEARARYINVNSGTGGTITIPNVEKLYLVRNATTGDVIFTTGAVGATNATVPAGVTAWVISEGTNVVRTITASNNFGTSGVIINGQALDGLTAAGVAIAEAADAGAQRGLLGLGSIVTRNKAGTTDAYSWTPDTALTADVIGAAFAPVTLSYAATTGIDWNGGYYRTLTLSGNVTLDNPSNVRAGSSRIIYIVGNDATARTVSFAANYKGDLPALSDVTSTKGYLITLFAVSATHIVPVHVRAL